MLAYLTVGGNNEINNHTDNEQNDTTDVRVGFRLFRKKFLDFLLRRTVPELPSFLKQLFHFWMVGKFLWIGFAWPGIANDAHIGVVL